MMIGFIERRMGAKKGIPTMVLAAASLDDVVAIVIFSVLLGFYTGTSEHVLLKVAGVPVSIIAGIGAGLLVGWGRGGGAAGRDRSERVGGAARVGRGGSVGDARGPRNAAQAEALEAIEHDQAQGDLDQSLVEGLRLGIRRHVDSVY